MYDGALNYTEVKARSVFSSSLTADYIGPARDGRRNVGDLYKASNGLTYFVPSISYGTIKLPIIDEAEEVISNPTGFYGDMLFISVSTHLMSRGGLKAALENACQSEIDRAQRLSLYC